MKNNNINNSTTPPYESKSNKNYCHCEQPLGCVAIQTDYEKLIFFNGLLCRFAPRNDGFTLAEVLITLVIIGVIAAITVPSLMNKTNNEEYVTRLKKANSVLNQAVHKMAENNGYSQGDYSFIHAGNFYTEFAKVVNVNEKCNALNTCMLSESYKTLNNNGYSMGAAMGTNQSIATTDGISYSYSNKPANVHGISEEDDNNTIGRILVDINGNKKPNKFGRDVFFFYLVNKKGIIPAGALNPYDCQINNSGKTCAGRVLKENAMNY